MEIDRSSEFRDEFDLGLFYADTHNDPRDSETILEVNSALGVFDLKVRPQVSANLGDWWNLRSLNVKRGSKLRGTDDPDGDHDLWDDIQVGDLAFKMFMAAVEADNERHRKGNHPERQHLPYRPFLAGNHEWFLAEMNKVQRSLKGVVSIKTLIKIVEKYGFHWLDYMEPLIIGGICVRHAHPGDNMAPIGVNSWIGNMAMSALGGHGHRFQVRETVRPERSRVSAIMLPSAMHPDKVRFMKTRIDTGALIVRNARMGTFQHEFVPMEEILQEYRDYKMTQRRKTDESVREILA